jgi:1-acyl-sn-glycerol-3-phosphate acyltransferase
LIYFFTTLTVSLFFIFLKSNHKRRIISRLIKIFALSLVRVINIKVKVSGDIRPYSANGKGAFFVSNHLSYVDGLVLGALFPLIYISKSELKKWPLIGPMTEFSGTLFIDRQRKNHIADYVNRIADVLKEGVNILFFPEGTSTNGEAFLPFKASFFEAPLRAGAPLVPVSINYHSIDSLAVNRTNRDSVYWYGEMTFADHFFRLLACRRIDVEVKIHPPIDVERLEEDNILQRKRAAELAYAAILKDIRLIKD